MAVSLEEEDHLLGVGHHEGHAMGYGKGYAKGYADAVEECAKYHDERGRIVARSSAYQAAWHKLSAKELREKVRSHDD